MNNSSEFPTKKTSKRRSVSGMLHNFMENHAPWFWVIFSIVIVLIVYKSFSLTFLKKTPYTWDDVFQHYTLALLCILIMRESYKGNFHLGFRAERFGLGLLLCWPAVPFLLFNLIFGITGNPVVPESLTLQILGNTAVGLFEEVLVRGILVGHMMHHWKGSRHRIFKSVFWSSFLFGILHIGNFFTNPANTVFQIFYAFGIGIMFAAAYLRSRNLWPCIIAHALVDLAANWGMIYVLLQPDLNAYQEDCYQLVPSVSEFISDQMLSYLPVIQLLWIFATTLIAILAGVFMLRKSKRQEVINLWEEM